MHVKPAETPMHQVAPDVWVVRYPLRALGIDFGRTVTILRLASQKLVIHSSAPFTANDVAALHKLGEPIWLVDATLFHDTYAKHGRKMFPELVYLDAKSLDSPPSEWSGEIDVLRLDGMPKVQEHVVLHRPSRTLIVCDLIFNFADSTSWWARWFIRNVMRLRDAMGVSLFFRWMIRDRQLFERSIETMLRWEFDRMIAGHGAVIERDAKQTIRRALHGRGFAAQSGR